MGKIRISTVLIILVVFYGGFVAVKIVSANLTKSQIKNEIIDKLGFVRGSDFTPELGEKIIREILEENDVMPPDNEIVFEEDGETKAGLKRPEIFVEKEEKTAKILFFVEYEYEVNLLLFKYKKIYTIDDEMMAYN